MINFFKNGVIKFHQSLQTAVVAWQIFYIYLTKIISKLVKKLLFATPKFIDALLRIAHVKEASKPVLSVSRDDFSDERQDDLVLDHVCILKLIDQEVIYPAIEPKIKRLFIQILHQKLKNQLVYISKT